MYTAVGSARVRVCTSLALYTHMDAHAQCSSEYSSVHTNTQIPSELVGYSASALGYPVRSNLGGSNLDNVYHEPTGTRFLNLSSLDIQCAHWTSNTVVYISSLGFVHLSVHSSTGTHCA